MKLDRNIINQEEFRITECELGTLFTPKASKHIWAEYERPFRSVILDKEDNVISSGFPKFHNYGEVPEIDKRFETLLATGGSGVKFYEKMDGSLIIADRFGEHIHFRTRGNWELGDFSGRVNALLRTKFNAIMRVLLLRENITYYTGESVNLDNFSFLFEYVGPDNQIVIRYDQAELVLLGILDKRTLTLIRDNNIMRNFAKDMGVRSAPEIKMSGTFNKILPYIRGWKGKEGVVAEFLYNNKLTLIKIKSDQYLKLHTIKFNLNEHKSQVLAYLLNINSEKDILPKLAEYGIDWEMAQYVVKFIRQFLKKKDVYHEAFNVLLEIINKMRAGKDLTRKDFVLNIQKFLAVYKMHFPEKHWFGVAMYVWDDNINDAKLKVDAMALDEPFMSLQQMIDNKTATIGDLVNLRWADTDNEN